jgi:hypothetical protein
MWRYPCFNRKTNSGGDHECASVIQCLFQLLSFGLCSVTLNVSEKKIKRSYTILQCMANMVVTSVSCFFHIFKIYYVYSLYSKTANDEACNM